MILLAENTMFNLPDDQKWRLTWDYYNNFYEKIELQLGYGEEGIVECIAIYEDVCGIANPEQFGNLLLALIYKQIAMGYKTVAIPTREDVLFEIERRRNKI